MKLAKHSTELEVALIHFGDSGGVVEYVILEAGREADLHRDAMLEALRQLKSHSQPKHLPYEPLRMIGSAVSLQQFLTAMGNGDEALYEIGILVDAPLFRLKGMTKETRKSFDAVNVLLFNGFSDDLEIVRWSEGWLEWWGAFWWTVHNRTTGQVVVIAACRDGLRKPHSAKAALCGSSLPYQRGSSGAGKTLGSGNGMALCARIAAASGTRNAMG